MDKAHLVGRQVSRRNHPFCLDRHDLLLLIATDWKPESPYNVGDIVIYDGIIYICNYSHTSSPLQPPPYATGSWQSIEKDSQSGVGGETASGTVPASGTVDVKDLILPYASEPFGVYQPLIGWKSELSQSTFHMP